MTSRLTKNLKKLFGGDLDDGQVGIFNNGEYSNKVSFPNRDLDDLSKNLEKIDKKLTEAKNNPRKFNKITQQFEKSCKAVGLDRMPQSGGVIDDILEKGNLQDLVNKTYVDETTGELVKCVSEKTAQAMKRFIEDKDNLKVASVKLDSDYEEFLTKLDMLEDIMGAVKPFVTGDPRMGHMGARLKLRKADGTERKVIGANGKPQDINTCQASTSRASCETKRSSLYGEPDACLWMPNYSHLTPQALAWEKETGNEGEWEKLQNDVCVPRHTFPFPMRKVTNEDMAALRSGKPWRTDKMRAMIKGKEGKMDAFAPNMKNPIDPKGQKFGHASAEETAGYLQKFANGISNYTVGLFQQEPEKKEPEKEEPEKKELPEAPNSPPPPPPSAEELKGGEKVSFSPAIAKHYEVDPMMQMHHSISKKLLEMPYFYTRDGTLSKFKPTPVEMKKVADYEAEATRVQRVFRASRRRLPERLRAKYEAEIAKQNDFREKAKATLIRRFNAEPTGNEIEDEVMATYKNKGARSTHALLQRLIYDMAVRGEWTELEVHEMLKQDTLRSGGHAVIVSTEPGLCNNAYLGISRELDVDNKTARKIFRLTDRVGGTIYGAEHGNAPLGNVFGVENDDYYKNKLSGRQQAAQRAATSAHTATFTQTFQNATTNYEAAKNVASLAGSKVATAARNNVFRAINSSLGEENAQWIASAMGFDNDRVRDWYTADRVSALGQSENIRTMLDTARANQNEDDRNAALAKVETFIKNIEMEMKQIARVNEDGTFVYQTSFEWESIHDQILSKAGTNIDSQWSDPVKGFFLDVIMKPFEVVGIAESEQYETPEMIEKEILNDKATQFKSLNQIKDANILKAIIAERYKNYAIWLFAQQPTWTERITDMLSSIGNAAGKIGNLLSFGTEEEYLVGGAILPAPPAGAPALDHVMTVLRGGGILPHKSFGELGQEKNAARDADTSDGWGLTQIFNSSVKKKRDEEKTSIKLPVAHQSNTCLHRVSETALILMKANMPKYLPFIQNYYKKKQAVLDDSKNVLSEKPMNTSIEAKKADQQVIINSAINNLNDEERFVKFALFDNRPTEEKDALEHYPQMEAKIGVGATLDSETEALLAATPKNIATIFLGPVMRFRDGIKFNDQIEPDKKRQILLQGLTKGLPWPVWSSIRTIKALRSQRARGKAGKQGHSLLARISQNADQILMKQSDMDTFEKKWKEAYKKRVTLGTAYRGVDTVRDWDAISEAVGGLDEGRPFEEGQTSMDKYNNTMDQIDVVRIILQNEAGSSLRNDDMMRVAFRAFKRISPDDFE